MLYEQWRKVALAGRNEVALRDEASGRRWTFAALAEAADDGEVLAGAAGMIHPRGQGAEFVLDVLRGWRDGRVVCPLEPGQAPPQVHTAPPDTAHLKLTSATTGPARCVRLTAEQLAADARNIVASMGLRPDRPNLGVISLAHSYGFSNLITPLLLHGIPLVLVPSVLPEAVRRATRDLAALTLPAVPALWRTWFDAGTIPAGDCLAISAGAPLPLALEESVWARFGLKIHNFYGASECGGIAYDATAQPRTDASAAGSPLRGVEPGINGEGCLAVRGPAVASGYWPEESPGLGQGVYQTSDLAEVRDGVVHLLGRAGDVIHVGGRKVAPEVIERVLGTHPAVGACLVLGLAAPDEHRGECIGAIVQLKDHATEAGLRAHLLAQLPAWQVPREWWMVESLAPNARGKLSRAAWRELWRNR